MSEIFEVYSKDEIDEQVMMPLAQIATNILSFKQYATKDSNGNIIDWTPAFQQAFSSNYLSSQNFSVPAGTYPILGTITLSGQNQTLYLEAGSTLQKPANAANTDPIVHISGTWCALRSDGQGTATIKQLCPSPFGIISIGDLDPTRPLTGAVGYNTFTNIMLWGAGSAQSGNPNYGLYMCDVDGNVNWSYYHIIQNIHIRYVNVGIGLIGNANANLINNITLAVVGQNNYLNGYDSGILMLQNGSAAPLENAISNIFHTGSNNATTLLMNGKCNNNSITNLISEVGGNGALWAKAINYTGCSGNVIQGVGNAYSGYSLPSDFLASNTVIEGVSGNVYSKNITANNNLTSSNLSLNGYKAEDNISKITKYATLSNAQQNTAYKLFDLSIALNEKLLVEVRTIHTAGVSFTRRVGVLRFVIDTSNNQVNILSFDTDGVQIYQPVISGSTLSLYTLTVNNGTTQTINIKTSVTIESFYQHQITDLTMNTTVTAITPTGYTLLSKGFGTASIAASGTSVVVNHNLGLSPTMINVTPQGNVGNVWVDTITSTQFTIHCSTAPASATVVSWHARV
jgi:hypothetical protein